MIFIAVLLCCLGALVSSAPQKVFYNVEDAQNHFENFVQKYNKTYKSEEERQERFEIFKNNLVKLNELNKNSTLTIHGKVSFLQIFATKYLPSSWFEHESDNVFCFKESICSRIWLMKSSMQSITGSTPAVLQCSVSVMSQPTGPEWPPLQPSTGVTRTGLHPSRTSWPVRLAGLLPVLVSRYLIPGKDFGQASIA